ncbi:LCP family protein [Candidatus Pseudoruminococcus sp.]|uniref:LCP family protein n=1 Tax=Candidatus Pseudoruminococcus sp. TaxID=3101048 RepID=UPI003999B408
MQDSHKNDDFEDIFSDSSYSSYDDIDNFPVEVRNRPSGNAPKKNKSQKFKKMWIANIAICLVSVIFILGGSACIYAYSSISRINYNKFPENSSSTSSKSPSSSTVESSTTSYNMGTIPDTLKSDNDVLNIMLFGADKKVDGEAYGRSDSMILLSINNRTGDLVMTSFLRDLWVEIPGYFPHRLNTSYALGGAELAIETIEYNFGVDIDRYAIVDFDSFTNIIDTLGGIDLELTDEEIDYINWQCWKNKQVETRHEITAKAGVVHLNGRQALWYSRDRDSAGSDWDRTNRQRIVLNTIMKDMKQSNLAQIMSIIYQVGPMIETDLDKGEIVYLAQNALNYLNYDVTASSVPDLSGGNFSCPKIDDMDVVTINDWDAERARIQMAIFGSSDYEVSNNSSEETTTDEQYNNAA